VRPSRDLSHLHADLIRRGAARELAAADGGDLAFTPPPPSDLDAVLAKVRELMGVPGAQ